MVYFDIVGDCLANYYHDGNFYRSEVVVKTIKDEFQLPNSDDVIAVSSGFQLDLEVQDVAMVRLLKNISI